MRHVFGIIVFLLASSLSAQTVDTNSQDDKDSQNYIQGVISNETDKTPIDFAIVRLLNKMDSTYIKGIGSDKDGTFKLATTKGNYILHIAAISYHDIYIDLSVNAKTPHHNLDTIRLKANDIALNEVVVSAQVPDIVLKGDTIEYNATSYTSQETDMLKDMLKNIPGVEVSDEGEITANGKPITKILVDGKEFFGNDMALALKNLPAGMIKKLQLFNEESDQAKLTGIKDKDPEQVINLVVKEELKKSIFGNSDVGYGNKGRYSAKLSLNKMRDKTQLSLLGNIENVDSYQNMAQGETRNKGIGTNIYINPSKKLKLGGNIQYGNNYNARSTRSNTETFLSSGDRYTKGNSKNATTGHNVSTNMRIEWQIDSLTTLYVRPNIRYNTRDNDATSNQLSYVIEQDSTTTVNNNSSRSNSYTLGYDMTIGRKLNKRGSVLTFRANQAYNYGDTKGTSYSENKYSDGSTPKIIDQKRKTNDISNRYQLSLNYVEQLGKGYSLFLTYEYANNHATHDRNVLKKDESNDYVLVDSAYTRYTVNDNVNQTMSMGLQRNREKYNYTIEMQFMPSYTQNVISLGDSLIDKVKQNVWNYAPNVQYTYRPNQSTSFDIQYRGSTTQPSVNQLSADTTIVNASYKYYGNPGLKPSYRNNINVNYRKSDYEIGKFMMISGQFGYVLNSIVNYSEIDSKGNRTDTYKNVDGNMNASLRYNQNMPLRNKKLSISAYSFVSYTKNIGYANGDKNKTKNIGLSQNIGFRFKSKVFESSLSGTVSYNKANNNLTKATNSSVSQLMLSHFMRVNLPYDFSIQSTISYTKYKGYAKDFKSNQTLWTGEINKKIFKNKKGILRARFVDILDDANNVSRQVNSNYISESHTNALRRYMLFSFSYQFNSMGK